jgi:hypothetical protein
MAFIEKKDPVVINIKLTSCGRDLLSKGQLTFNYFAIGDSEIDYNFINEVKTVDSEYSAFNSSILRPVDKNPQILSFITKNLTGTTGYEYNSITNSPISYNVVNSVDSIGFFTSGGTAFIVDSNHVKQPDAMVYMSGITGGTTLRLRKAPTYGTSGLEPATGDSVLIRWTFNTNTTGYTINKNSPTPHLIYQIISKTGTLAADNLIVTIDRNLPNFNGFSATGIAGALIYYSYINYSGDTIFNDYSTDYLDESVISFLENSQCPTVVFPFWNMSIIYTEEIAGVSGNNRTYGQFNSRTYGGFVSYIQNQAPIYKKLGVIHYTNSSPANVYGEGFNLKTPKLEIPIIMWHKSLTLTMGLTLTPIGSVKYITGVTTSLNTPYYDLADPEGNIVGKVFNELKIFVIEDQELLFAMSYKANRSWTLPDYLAGTTNIITVPCEPVTTWMTPIINNPGLTIVSQCYCHSTSGWTSFPVGGHISCVGVDDAGYKICVCWNNPGTASICARDYTSGYNLYTCSCNPGLTFNFSTTLSILNVNHVKDYCFGGCLY